MKKVFSKTSVVYLLLILSMFFWGSSFIWAKQALEFYSPFTIIFFRLLISGIFLFSILLVTKKIQIPKLKDLPSFFLMSFFEPFLYFMGETNSLQYLDASTTAIMISIIPLITPFVAYIFLKERIAFFNILGIIISIIGIVILVFDFNFQLQVSWKGLLLVFLSLIAANGYSVMIKKIDSYYSVFNVTMWQNIIGMFLFLPFLIFFDGKLLLQKELDLSNFLNIVYLGIFASSFAFIFYMHALRHLPISRTSVFTNSIPIFTLIISFFAFGEGLDLKKMIGILIIVAGVIFSQLFIKPYNNLKSK